MKNRFWLLISLVLIFAVASCATTTLTKVWKDPNFGTGTIEKMMVVGIAKDPATRRLFEDTFAQSLAAHGVSVIKSYEVITLEELNDKKGASEKIRSLEADSVLATRLINKETVETYYPSSYGYAPMGAYGRWDGYYGVGYSSIMDPGYIVSEQVAKLETNVYDIKTGELAWSALSDTWLDEAAQDRLISDFICVMVKRMTKDGLIPAAEKK
jgi:hypothetical protein